MTKQLSGLEKEIITKQRQIKQKIEEYNITIYDLEQYRLSRPIVDKTDILDYRIFEKDKEIKSLRRELLEYNAEILASHNSKSILESEFINANKKLPTNNPPDMKELSKITDEIYYYPGRNVDIIKMMRERYPNKPLEKATSINSKDK